MNAEWVAYATDFVSFLIHKLKDRDRDRLHAVVLFGSAVRGDTDSESDVDLFLDTGAPGDLEREARKILDAYETSIKVQRYWRLLGVSPELSLHVGDLASWSAAHPALLKDGRVLYGPYQALTPSVGQALAIIAWDPIASVRTRTNLYRSLHGYKDGDRRYPGLLEIHRGEKLSKGSILVPLPSLDVFKALFGRLEITARYRTVYEFAPPAPSQKARSRRASTAHDKGPTPGSRVARPDAGGRSAGRRNKRLA